jgi:hypothetical protein
MRVGSVSIGFEIVVAALALAWFHLARERNALKDGPNHKSFNN